MHAQSRTLCDTLHVDIPIIQSPMAGVSTPALAAAVSNAGALGSVSVGAVDADAASRMIEDVQARTNRALNVNVFCHQPATADPAREAAWLARLKSLFDEFGAEPPERLGEIYRSFIGDAAMQSVLIKARPHVVSFHFGLPDAASISALRNEGIVLLATATNLREGLEVQQAGIHAVVAQGWEAGGHRGVFDPDAPDGRLSTRALTRLLVRALDIPVISAGGIMDGTDIASLLQAGAAGVQMGTAFIACPESSADAAHRAGLTGDEGHRTIMTRVISGRPARGLPNRFSQMGESIPDSAVPAYPIAYDAGKALAAAARAVAEGGFAAQWAGQGAPFARAMPAGELVRVLWEEAEGKQAPT